MVFFEWMERGLAAGGWVIGLLCALALFVLLVGGIVGLMAWAFGAGQRDRENDQ